MAELAFPTTRYARSGELSIAYQVMGDGPVDLIVVPGIISHVEFLHEFPAYTDYLRRLSDFARVITFDKRGQGLSDRVSDVPSLEQRMDDVAAIMEAIGSKRAALLGYSEGAPMSVLFAATYRERTSHLILYGGFARFTNTNDYEFMFSEETMLKSVKYWGTGAFMKSLAPSWAKDPAIVAQFAKFERLSASPGAYKAALQQNALIDVRCRHRSGRPEPRPTILRDMGVKIDAWAHEMYALTEACHRRRVDLVARLAQRLRVWSPAEAADPSAMDQNKVCHQYPPLRRAAKTRRRSLFV